MKQGDRVEVINGEYVGKTGVITDTVQMGRMTLFCWVHIDDLTVEKFKPTQLKIIL